MKTSQNQLKLTLLRRNAAHCEVHDEHGQIVASISLTINNVWFIFDKHQHIKLHDVSYFSARMAFKALLNRQVLLPSD